LIWNFIQNHKTRFYFKKAVSGNVFGLAEGGEFERLMLKFTIMLNRIPNVEACNTAPLLANPC